MTVPTLIATAEASAQDAPLLVLGPSLGSVGSTLWRTTIPYLAERFRIVTWDLPGHGASPATREPFSVEELADGVVRILDELGVATACYAGVSIGGGTGLALGLRHPDRVEKVAIVCATARFGAEESWRDRAHQVRTQSTSSLVVASAQRWFAPGRMEADPVTSGVLLHNLQDADDESYALACEALAVFDVRDRMPAFPVPLLDVHGVADPTIDVATAERLVATTPGARLALIEDASHLATADQPKAVADALLAFL